MKYPYSVKCNGIWYAAGEELPAANTAKDIATVEEVSVPAIDEAPKALEKAYSKSELQRMNAAKLRDVAMENGIDDVEDKTRSELIHKIVKVLGL